MSVCKLENKQDFFAYWNLPEKSRIRIRIRNSDPLIKNNTDPEHLNNANFRDFKGSL